MNSNYGGGNYFKKRVKFVVTIPSISGLNGIWGRQDTRKLMAI